MDRRQEFLKLINTLYRDTDLVALFYIRGKERQQEFISIKELKAEDTWQRLHDKNKEWNVYLSVYNFTEPRRKEEFVEQRQSRIFLDFDRPGMYEAFKEQYDPSIVIQSSPGKFQCFLFTNDSEKDKLKNISRSLAWQWNADHAYDLSRVFRLPGFKNHKYEDKPTAYIKEWNINRTYQAETLPSYTTEEWQERNTPITPRTTQQQQRQQPKPVAGEYDYNHFAYRQSDLSRADMAYAVYLIGRRYTEPEAEYKLRQGRESFEVNNNIAMCDRLEYKKGNISDYISRTVKNAVDYQQSHYRPPVIQHRTEEIPPMTDEEEKEFDEINNIKAGIEKKLSDRIAATEKPLSPRMRIR